MIVFDNIYMDWIHNVCYLSSLPLLIYYLINRLIKGLLKAYCIVIIMILVSIYSNSMFFVLPYVDYQPAVQHIDHSWYLTSNIFNIFYTASDNQDIYCCTYRSK